MKISCLPVSFFGDIISGRITLGEWARMAYISGLDGVDISILFIKSRTPKYLNQLRKEIEDAEMQIIMITAYPDFTHPKRIQRKRELEYFRGDIALASELGAKYVRVTRTTKAMTETLVTSNASAATLRERRLT